MAGQLQRATMQHLKPPPGRGDWIAGGAGWTERTQDLESRLSDALHAALAQRFVDRRLALLLRDAGQSVPISKPYLELNPTHSLVQRLKAEADPVRFSDWTHLLFEQAVLAEGGQLEDPASFVKRLNGLLLAMG